MANRANVEALTVLLEEIRPEGAAALDMEALAEALASRGVLVPSALEDQDFDRIYGVDTLPDALDRISKGEFEPDVRARSRAG